MIKMSLPSTGGPSHLSMCLPSVHFQSFLLLHHLNIRTLQQVVTEEFALLHLDELQDTQINLNLNTEVHLWYLSNP